MPRNGIETRSLMGAELRAEKDGAGTRFLSGIIPYNSRSVDLGGFSEVIAPGAFADALAPDADVLCLRDHKQELLMGRTTSKTMTLTDSADGLRWRVQLPNTQQAEDLAESVSRGDLNSNSFGFICKRGGDKWERTDGGSLRTLTGVELLEISPCSFAAYPASTAALRSCPPEIRSSLNVKAEKRYKRVLSAVTGTYWCITESKLQTICDVLSVRASGGQVSKEEVRAAMMSQHDEVPQGNGKVAIIPMYGVITQRSDFFSEWSGGCSIQALQRSFRSAMADTSIETIVFDVDSPGGAVSGVPEFADEVYQARSQGKKIVFAANSNIGSAAYMIASQGDELIVTPSGSVGSVGVYMVHEDDSQLLEDLGVKMTLIKSGEHKAEGVSFQPLSKDTISYWQTECDAIYADFVSKVARGRGVDAEDVEENFGQGRMVMATVAVDANMADRIATFDQVMAELGVIDPRTQMDPSNLLTGFDPNMPDEDDDDDIDVDEWRANALLGIEIRKRRVVNLNQ